MEVAELTKEQKNEKWKLITESWKSLKGETDQQKKLEIQTMINSLQRDLSIDVTDFTKPYKPKSDDSSPRRFFKPTPKTREQRKQFVQEFFDDVAPVVDRFITTRLKTAGIDYTFQDRIIALEALLKPAALVYTK